MNSVAVLSSLALGFLLLAGIAPACAGPGKCPVHDPQQVQTSVHNLDRIYGKQADQKIRLPDGHRLLVWSYSINFSELEPGRYAFVAVACGGEILGVEKVWAGARIGATGGGDIQVSWQDYEMLANASEPKEQKLAVLRGMKFAVPLFSSEAQ